MALMFEHLHSRENIVKVVSVSLKGDILHGMVCSAVYLSQLDDHSSLCIILGIFNTKALEYPVSVLQILV